MIQPSERRAGSSLSAGLGAGGRGISVPPQTPRMGMRLKTSSQAQGVGDRFAVLCAVLHTDSPVASALLQGLWAGWDPKRWMSFNPKALPMAQVPELTEFLTSLRRVVLSVTL